MQVAKLLQAAMLPCSKAESQQPVGLAYRKRFRESPLNPPLEAEWLVASNPEIPRSRFQKFLLAANGRAWLVSQMRTP